MKAIKIILGIITVLVLVFFATGLIVKETKYKAQVSIEKPVEEVFNEFNKPENIKNWIPEVQSFETVNKNPGITGSVYKLVVNNQGQEITMTEKVMAYVPNEKVTLFFDAENMLKKDDYIFTEKEGLTTVTLNASCKSDSYVMACIFPYFKGTFKEQDQTYLNNFKKYIEGEKEE
ncbi:SRPBCC family protein [Polaribacter batillariae]|uniref:SRPBCC family protein n=1 Tax=Polaribacter batillariae TaxID=2808900 RepID=A0ABX7ST16_9FLAO|nr:SRPBCC family protein [Polaribacter batillariae]QTD37387.1 SRPBCC family protein [Polaribacter batillariae]